jgi:hypothetical protein
MTDDGEARYEFRVFGGDLELLRPQLEAASARSSTQSSAETYIVTRLNIEAGVKIRDNCLEMKLLRARDGILEQWAPALQLQLPIGGATFKDDVAPALGASVDLPDDAQLTESGLTDIAQSVPALAAIALSKTRTQFELPGCTAELTLVEFDGSSTQTVAFEGTDMVAVMQAVRQLGLEQRTNESYPCYLQRVLF